MSAFRNKNIGFVFQFHQLLPDDGDIALRIYFAQAGEDMFDIAKRYAASPEAIAAANDTGSGILEAPQRLLIPSAT